MNFKQIQAFTFTYQMGSLKKAAEKLFITQSTLSKQIHALEDEFSGKLFHRTSTTLQPTRLAQIIYADAIALLDKVRDLTIETTFYPEAAGAEIYIGALMPSLFNVAKLTAAFKKEHNSLEIALDLGSRQMHCDALLKGRIHVAFLTVPPALPLQCTPVFHDDVVLIVHKNHLQKSGLPYDANAFLNYYPLILIEPENNVLHHLTNRYLHDNNIIYHKLEYTNSPLTLLALISAGLGVGITFKSIMDICNDDFHYIPLKGGVTTSPLYMVWNPLVKHETRDRFISFCLIDNQRNINENFFSYEEK